MFLVSTSTAMLVTGIILAPAVIATPAVQDLADLRAVIKSAASTIGDLKNPNRGWGLFGSGSEMGTADLINNVTSTILQSKFQVDTNKTAWLSSTNITTGLPVNTSVPSPPTLPLPLTASMVLPTTLPTSAPGFGNITTDLSTPYIDYISAIPDLSTSLTSLGRVWHREMNSPVRDAIGVLQESINTLQTTMLQGDFISSPAVLRTIRASSSLESAQQAWSRFLNLPGNAGSGDNGEDTSFKPNKRSLHSPPANGKQYSHKELWGREWQSKSEESSLEDVVIERRVQVEDSRRNTAQTFKA